MTEALQKSLSRFTTLYGYSPDDPPMGWVQPEMSWLRDDARRHDAESLLSRMCESAEMVASHSSFRARLDDVFNDATSGVLLKDLLIVLASHPVDAKLLQQGIMWAGQAMHLNPDLPMGAGVLSMGGIFDGAKQEQAHYQRVGSLILVLYICVCNMRDGVTSAIVKVGCDSGAPTLERLKLLLHHDVYRHFRNALAHGQVSSHVGGLRVQDRQYEAVITPAAATLLSATMMAIHHQCLAALSRLGRLR